MGHEFEELSGRVLGAAVEIHKALGPGFRESIYQRAMEVALEHRGIAFEGQKEVHVGSRESTWAFSALISWSRSMSSWS